VTKGWQPLSKPTRRAGAESFQVSPFGRLARVHALSVATDTLIATSLAGSLFFSIPTGAARGRVALYLALTMAPFALVAPLIGPAIDRIAGGRRLMVIVTAVARALVCLFMAQHVNDLFLFPCAFLVLVFGKAYGIAKAALVPTVVNSDEELVGANSRLSLLSGIVGFVAAVPGIIALKLFGPEWSLFLAVLTSAACAVLATQLPAAPVAPEPADDVERVELRGQGIVRAAEAMGLLRGMVGFLTFLLAFDLRGGGNDGPVPVGLALGRAVSTTAKFQPVGTGHLTTAPTWHFGVVLGVSVAGGLLGAVLAPQLRKYLNEERILLGCLVGVAVMGLLAAAFGGLFGAALMGMAVGVGASAGRLAFDAIVQRDAPDANFGRSFAKFETRFQIVWVIGGFLPVIVPIPAQIGFLVVAAAAGFAAFAYVTGQRGLRRPRAQATVAPT
jgi:hypothetical protein